MRLAYFSPLSPQRSGIADYSEELLPHLAAAGAEIDLFVDGFEPESAEMRARFRIFDYRAEPRQLKRLGDYEAVVYHMGNDYRYHAGIYEAARAHPGVVVLHDFALQTFFLGLARARDDVSVYLEELEACHGRGARAEAAEALERGAAPRFYAQPVAFPLNCRLARDAEGIIVHSEWSRARLAAVAPATPVAVVKHHVVFEPQKEMSACETREDSGAGGLSEEKGADGSRWRVVEIASFGHVTAEKGVGRVLGALASLRRDCEFRFTLVGQPEGFDAREVIREHDLADRVEVTGYVALAEFKARLAACDIAINLRERTVGETSGSVCRALAAGAAVIVSNVGWFAELPDDCVIKIDEGDAGDEQLRVYLARLIADEGLRRRLGANARRYALAEHAIERSAAGYLAFLRRVVARRARRRFVGGVTDELAACGVREEDETLLRGVATEVARLAPARIFEEKGSGSV
jgi:glycosyltransferase involved in cell wall biosynthesis